MPGDDPDALVRRQTVAGQEPEALLEAQLVLDTVFLAEITPISTDMAMQQCERRNLGCLQEPESAGVATTCPTGKRACMAVPPVWCCDAPGRPDPGASCKAERSSCTSALRL